jgi:hypothetical protein
VAWDGRLVFLDPGTYDRTILGSVQLRRNYEQVQLDYRTTCGLLRDLEARLEGAHDVYRAVATIVLLARAEDATRSGSGYPGHWAREDIQISSSRTPSPGAGRDAKYPVDRKVLTPHL